MITLLSTVIVRLHVSFSPPELQCSHKWTDQHRGAGSLLVHDGDYKMDNGCKQLTSLTPIRKKSPKITTKLLRSSVCSKWLLTIRKLASYNEWARPDAPSIPKSRLVSYLKNKRQPPTLSVWQCEWIGMSVLGKPINRFFVHFAQWPVSFDQPLPVLHCHQFVPPPSPGNRASMPPQPHHNVPDHSQRLPSEIPCQRPWQKSCWTAASVFLHYQEHKS